MDWVLANDHIMIWSIVSYNLVFLPKQSWHGFVGVVVRLPPLRSASPGSFTQARTWKFAKRICTAMRHGIAPTQS